MPHRREDASFVLLEALAEAGQPLGARQAKAALASAGISISESSASRLLRDLDGEGLVATAGAKGRVITEEGRRRVAELHGVAATSARLQQAVDVRAAKDLLDLLHARRTVEREIVREAAEHAGEKDLTDLRDLTRRHALCISKGEVPQTPGLDFHRRIIRLSRNRPLRAMADVVLGPRYNRVETLLDIIMGNHHTETKSVGEHERILDAIAAGDAATAERTMNDHLLRMSEEVERYLPADNDPLFQRLLSWMDTQESLRPA
ncbi:FCD domain-containing protein [Streptomyces sp. NPDC044780]|uniref:FCD domain-containing protein n=1 Tax=unclassified Streptomyces TaxID=2593676 RepID=UPI0033D68167